MTYLIHQLLFFVHILSLIHIYNAGDVVAESLTTGTDGQVVLSDLHLGTYVVTEIKSIDGYTINTTPQTVAVEYKRCV